MRLFYKAVDGSWIPLTRIIENEIKYLIATNQEHTRS